MTSPNTTAITYLPAAQIKTWSEQNNAYKIAEGKSVTTVLVEGTEHVIIGGHHYPEKNGIRRIGPEAYPVVDLADYDCELEPLYYSNHYMAVTWPLMPVSGSEATGVCLWPQNPPASRP